MDQHFFERLGVTDGLDGVFFFQYIYTGLAKRAIFWIFCRSREAASGAVLENFLVKINYQEPRSGSGAVLRFGWKLETSVVQSGESGNFNFTQEKQLVALRHLLIRLKLKLVFVKRFTTPTPFVIFYLQTII